MDNYLFEVPEAPLHRKRIENDLLARHQHLKRKIEALKLKRIKEETKHNQSIPTINPNSRRIAASIKPPISQSDSRLKRTYEILAASRFLPKKASICLESLSTSVTPAKPTNSFIIYKADPPIPTRITFPSLDLLNKPSDQCESLPDDILKRNNILNTLRAETVTRGFVTEPEEPPVQLTIHERTQKWLRSKQEKLKKLRKESQDRVLGVCSFKPKIRSQACFSVSRTQRAVKCSYLELYERKLRLREEKGSKTERTVSLETKPATTIHSTRRPSSVKSGVFVNKYNSLCPVSLSVGQLSGFNRVAQKYKFLIDSNSVRLV